MKENLRASTEHKPQRKLERAIGIGLIAISAFITHVVTERSDSGAVSIATREYKMAERADAGIVNNSKSEANYIKLAESIDDPIIRKQAERTVNLALGIRAITDIEGPLFPNKTDNQDSLASFDLITEPSLKREVRGMLNDQRIAYVYSCTDTAPDTQEIVNIFKSEITNRKEDSQLETHLNLTLSGHDEGDYESDITEMYMEEGNKLFNLQAKHVTIQDSIYSHTKDAQPNSSFDSGSQPVIRCYPLPS